MFVGVAGDGHGGAPSAGTHIGTDVLASSPGVVLPGDSVVRVFAPCGKPPESYWALRSALQVDTRLAGKSVCIVSDAC